MLVESRALELIGSLMKNKSINGEDIKKILLERGILVDTDDGTYTLRSEKKDELMHSTIGAMTESFEKFAIPSAISELKNPKLLDLCSGLGYNTLASLKHNRDVSIDMVEISRELIFMSQYISRGYDEQKLLNNAVSDFFKNRENKKIRIFCDDARIILQEKEYSDYDIIFHDGFSPANDPVLYSADFLELLYNHLNDKGLLLSYSSSIPFRSGLIEAGFYIGEGVSIGRKRGITIAAKTRDDFRITDRLPSSDELLIALSTIGEPFRDQNLSSSSDEIHDERERKREERKLQSNYISTKQIKKGNIDERYLKIIQKASNSRDAIINLKKLYKMKG